MAVPTANRPTAMIRDAIKVSIRVKPLLFDKHLILVIMDSLREANTRFLFLGQLVSFVFFGACNLRIDPYSSAENIFAAGRAFQPAAPHIIIICYLLDINLSQRLVKVKGSTRARSVKKRQLRFIICLSFSKNNYTKLICSRKWSRAELFNNIVVVIYPGR